MLVRIVKHEVEASLAAPTGERCGKSEYKVYGNGERRLTVRIRRLEAPVGQAATIVIAGRECARLTTTGDSLFYDARTSRGETVPESRQGESVEVRVNGDVVAAGVYRPD